MLASGVFAGMHSLDYAYGRKDMDGKTYGEELQRIGWLGAEDVGAQDACLFRISHRARPDP